ncbi:hypothetical protein [Sorangium cellulosum]|uniref:Uncharacterized protein n=1 Tax=Sorangium cellulosum TaxID=56 RepID=A0A150QFY2_SORCE|nr:hypothetical protein [Sorangium cellulosum]KYF66850.1 hypothetical protein BE15_39115 [Sorangium cellulosum]
MTDQQNPPAHDTEPTIRDRYLVAAYLLQHNALKNEALDRGHRGEVEALIAEGPLDVDLYNQLWSSIPGVFGRNLERARKWLGSWSDTRPVAEGRHEPAPHPAAALFGADPRLAEGVDAAAAAVAIEVTATQLANAITGLHYGADAAAPRVVRVRDAVIAFGRAVLLGARALGATERPSSAAHEGLATPPTSADLAAARERGEPAPTEVRVTTAGGSSGALWLDAAVGRLAEVITGFRSDGSSAYLAPADPEEPVEAYGRRRHAAARDGLIELVRAVTAPAAAVQEPTAQGTRGLRWTIEPQRRALLVDWLAARHPEIPSEERGTLIDVVLASVTAPPTDRSRVGSLKKLLDLLVDATLGALPGYDVQFITRPLQPGELERMRGIFLERAEQLGLDGAEVSR